MTTDVANSDGKAMIEVALPEPLLEEIDAYKLQHGHMTRSAVVSEALEE